MTRSKILRVVYVLMFLAGGIYASLLLLSSMWGKQSAANTLIYACGVIFIVRAVFASRAGIQRLRDANAPAAPRRTSDMVFAVGDGIALGFLACTAHLLATGDHRLGTPVVPFGMGLALAYLFYLVAACLRFSDKRRAMNT